MKRTDVKTGVVYAYQQGQYGMKGGFRAIVVLDTSTFWAAPAWDYGKAKAAGITRPKYEAEPLENGKPRFGGWTASDRRGLLAVALRFNGSWNERPKTKEPIDRLLKVTLDRVRSKPEGVWRWSLTDNDEWQIEAMLVNPRYIIGDYAEEVGAREDEAERRRIINAEKKAESDARVAAAQRRIDALHDRGILVEDAQESKAFRYSGSDWEPDVYTGNTKDVRLTLAQVDALLSLIPEGARYVPDEPNVAEDGFSYRHPEGVPSP